MSDLSRYLVPSGIHRVEETIQKSRFVTTAARASDPGAARKLVAQVQDKFPNATHHCWAFVAGPSGSTAHVGVSDDGEPHGTAGRPMLKVLLYGGVGEIVVVCARYYGGVKLGTGGLSRAYSRGVKLVLDSLPTVEHVERTLLHITVPYVRVDSFQRLAREADVLIENEEYAEAVRYRCGVPADGVEVFTQAVSELTRGDGLVQKI